MARSSILEKDIQKVILEWLGYQSRMFVWRQNSGARGENYTRKSDGMQSRHFFKTASVDGISDIMGVWDGHPLAIEVKRPKEKPTANQEEFLNNFARAGGIAIVAHSLEEVQESFKRVVELQRPLEGIYIRNL